MRAKNMSDQIVLQNLKRIWEQKKRERGITQVTAARDLGWTQGALSQYLNNLTELSPGAIIKMANYLEVSAAEIDPSIYEVLPKFGTVRVRHRDLDVSTLRDTKRWFHTITADPDVFVIDITKDAELIDNSRLLFENTQIFCMDTAKKQSQKQPEKPVTTYSVLYQKKKSEKKLTVQRLPYQEWKVVDTSNFIRHYTIISLHLV